MSGLQSTILFSRDGNSPGILQRGGAILRGNGPPSPAIGHVGNVYIDITTWNLYQRRLPYGLDPWGFPLFTVPDPYRYYVTHYGPGEPSNTIGAVGDYYFQWGCNSAGVFPLVYGPKLQLGWPGVADGAVLEVSTSTLLQIGLSDEGTALAFPSVAAILELGLVDENTSTSSATVDLAIPLGLSSPGFVLPATINPSAFAEAEKAV